MKVYKLYYIILYIIVLLFSIIDLTYCEVVIMYKTDNFDNNIVVQTIKIIEMPFMGIKNEKVMKYS